MSGERLTPAQRERIRNYYQECLFIREHMPSCVLRLIDDLEAVERERDEREEAARSLLKYVNPSWKTAAKSQWPWLKETQ